MKKLLLLAMAVSLGVVGLVSWQKKSWDMQTRFTVIDLGKAMQIMSFDPATGSGLILVIPDNFEIDTLSGRGGWRAEVMDKASRQWGQKWAADSVADYLGITYTGIREKLGVWDRILWRWYGRNVQWETVELGKTSLLVDVKDPDGVILSRLAEKWPEKAAAWFTSANLAREQINVNIINSTNLLGLGAHVARIVENGGVRVVSVGNSQTELGRCLLEGSEGGLKSLTGRWLLRNFGCNQQIKTDESDLTLTVGNEYKQYWMGD